MIAPSLASTRCRRQYPDYAAALEARFLRQSALRREAGRYKALYRRRSDRAGGLSRPVAWGSRARVKPRPRRVSILVSDRSDLITRLDFFAGLDPQHLARVQKLMGPRFTVPNELIVRKGERGDAVFFIASGAAEVILPGRRVPLGSGELFGEMALITGEPRQADVRAQTYCRLLVLRKADFDRFMQRQSGRQRPGSTRSRRSVTQPTGRRRRRRHDR